MLPAKADPDTQARYRGEEVEPRLAQARAGQRAVFFVAAAHFVLAPFLGFLWSVTRLFLRAPAGRQRFNVLGALNALTPELVTVPNATSITATEVCGLLRQLVALNLDVPLTVVLDNARYQRCTQVVPLAASLQIELGFLPPYSPNLNLIERLWKFVKKQCLYSMYYADFTACKTAIVQCLAQTQTTHRTALDSLLTLRFQLFAKAQFVPA
jgi:transposase